MGTVSFKILKEAVWVAHISPYGDFILKQYTIRQSYDSSGGHSTGADLKKNKNNNTIVHSHVDVFLNQNIGTSNYLFMLTDKVVNKYKYILVSFSFSAEQCLRLQTASACTVTVNQ